MTSVLHVEKNEAGEPVLVEYPSNFIRNPDLELKWVGWEDYDGEYIPDDDYSTAQPAGFGPENLDFHGMGANIFERDGKVMLRFVAYVDPLTEIVKCIECSYTPEGWYIEDMQMIYDYWGGGWEAKLMGDPFLLNVAVEDSPADDDAASQAVIADDTQDGGETEDNRDIDISRFWEEEMSEEENTLKFITGLEVILPDGWKGKTVYDVITGPLNDPVSTTLIVSEKTNKEAATDAPLDIKKKTSGIKKVVKTIAKVVFYPLKRFYHWSKTHFQWLTED